ncbi:MAG: VOC family protein [Bryobacteraceae bacterium]|jgi:catechol 2,3-dioxygenase-like lactoylglutathione lyase family enzyme
MKTFYITAGVLALASLGLAQSAAPTDGRVSNSHIHLFTKDLEVQRHFWVDIMGATAGKMGPDRDSYTLPKVLVIVDKGNPTAGTEGSIVNHVGFKVRDMKGTLDKVTAQHFTIQTQNPNQAFILGPDDIRVELLTDKNLATVSENHQVHFFTPDIDAMQKWYVANFGAAPSAFGKVKVATLPGVTLLFSPTDTPVAGTKGRALDHIGFEVKDLEGFSKTLESNGVKLDTPYRKIPQMGFAVAFLTDPWGTRIELTERSAPSPSAQSQKPAQQ